MGKSKIILEYLQGDSWESGWAVSSGWRVPEPGGGAGQNQLL